MRVLRASALAIAIFWMTILIGPRDVTHAASYSIGDDGNCNGWIPHGWSWTSWSGEPTNASGSVRGQLQWYYAGTWYVQLDRSSTISNQSSADANIDNYFGISEQGTGSWREIGCTERPFFRASEPAEVDLVRLRR